MFGLYITFSCITVQDRVILTAVPICLEGIVKQPDSGKLDMFVACIFIRYSPVHTKQKKSRNEWKELPHLAEIQKLIRITLINQLTMQPPCKYSRQNEIYTIYKQQGTGFSLKITLCDDSLPGRLKIWILKWADRTLGGEDEDSSLWYLPHKHSIMIFVNVLGEIAYCGFLAWHGKFWDCDLVHKVMVLSEHKLRFMAHTYLFSYQSGQNLKLNVAISTRAITKKKLQENAEDYCHSSFGHICMTRSLSTKRR